MKELIAEYHRELNRLSGQVDIEQRRQTRELRLTDEGIRAIIDSIKAGFRTNAMREELERLEAQKLELNAKLTTKKANPVRLHPNLADVYRTKIDSLREAPNHEDERQEAGTILRSLIDEIRLVPENGKLRVHLVGHLAELMALTQNKQPNLKEIGLSATLVAGARYPLYRKTLWLLRGSIISDESPHC